MKHVVVIDDKTLDGAALLKQIKEMSNETVEFIDDEETIKEAVPVEVWADKLRSKLKKAYDKKN
jgi:hypothetical protein